jgi:hypothetical protein
VVHRLAAVRSIAPAEAVDVAAAAVGARRRIDPPVELPPGRRRICGKQPEAGVLLGCAQRPNADGVPFVALADDATVRATGWTPGLNELHESGHLNGAWTHDGWRALAKIGAPAAETPAKPMPTTAWFTPPTCRHR